MLHVIIWKLFRLGLLGFGLTFCGNLHVLKRKKSQDMKDFFLFMLIKMQYVIVNICFKSFLKSEVSLHLNYFMIKISICFQLPIAGTD